MPVSWRRVVYTVMLLLPTVVRVSAGTEVSEEADQVLLLKNETYGEYWWYRGQGDWFEANEKCEDEGGHLATVKEDHIRTSLMDKFTALPAYEEYGSSFWLGATIEADIGWTWLGDDKSADINVNNSLYPCASMRLIATQSNFDGKDKCATKLRYMCGKKGCHGNLKCYHQSDVKHNWQAARLDCQSKGMDLATFGQEIKGAYTGQSLNTLLEEMQQDDSKLGFYWIGLVNNLWKWVDGDYVVSGSELWNPRALKETKEECMIMWKSGHWVPKACKEKQKSYMCLLPVNTGIGSTRTTICVLIICLLIIAVIIIGILFYRRKMRTKGQEDHKKNGFKKIWSGPSKSSDNNTPSTPPGLYASIELWKPTENQSRPSVSKKPDPNPYSKAPNSPPPAVPFLADGYSEPAKGKRIPSVEEAQYSVPYEKAPPKPPRIGHQVEPHDTVLVDNDLYCST